MAATDHPSDRRPRSDDDDPTLCAHLEPTAEGASCTLYPADLSADEWTTKWLSADAGSYVTLSEMR